MPSGSAAMLARISASARARQRVQRGGDRIVAVVVEQRVHALLAEVKRVELTVEVAAVGLRHARIGGEDIDDVLLSTPRLHQFHRRHAEAFLKAFGRSRIETAGHVAADVEPVADRGEPAEHLPARITGRTSRKSLRWVPPS